jgi:ATP-dependent protease Clp ATPase subunit
VGLRLRRYDTFFFLDTKKKSDLTVSNNNQKATATDGDEAGTGARALRSIDETSD